MQSKKLIKNKRVSIKRIRGGMFKGLISKPKFTPFKCEANPSMDTTNCGGMNQKMDQLATLILAREYYAKLDQEDKNKMYDYFVKSGSTNLMNKVVELFEEGKTKPERGTRLQDKGAKDNVLQEIGKEAIGQLTSEQKNNLDIILKFLKSIFYSKDYREWVGEISDIERGDYKYIDIRFQKYLVELESILATTETIYDKLVMFEAELIKEHSELSERIKGKLAALPSNAPSPSNATDPATTESSAQDGMGVINPILAAAPAPPKNNPNKPIQEPLP
jgi:hypothetical protein